MGPFRNTNGWDWHKIAEGFILAIAIAFLTGSWNWFMNVRDMKRDIQDVRAYVKRVSITTSQIGATLWNHLHPDEPCPFQNPQEDNK